MKNIFKIIPVIIVGLTLFSCESGEPENVEIVSMDDLMGDSDIDTIDSLVIDLDSSTIKGSILSNLVSSLDVDYDTTALNENHVFDRYGFNSFEKVEFVGRETVPYGKSNMVKPKAEFYLYNFSDSIKLNNAFYNWLDCFGSDCNPVNLNQDIESVKTPPSLTLVYDTTLISVKYLCEHEKNDWQSFQDSIVKQYGNDYRYRIDVGCGGPLIWK